MATTYANSADVRAGREAISVLFGVEQVREAGQDEVLVRLSRELTLGPRTAKRLAIDLKNAVEDLETQHAARPAASADSARARTAPQLERILTLFRLLGGLNAEVDFERSFKVVHGHLLENRFLLGINRRDAGDGGDGRIAAICENVGMPHDLLTSFSQMLPDANHVYFGVEKDDQSLILKAYVECRDKIEKEIAGGRAAGSSFPLFAGFKWDTSTPGRQAITRYAWYPLLPLPEILERVRMMLDPQRHGELLAIVQGIADRAAGKISREDIQYLEVSEQGNARKSFDINLYKAGLRLSDLFPQLLGALRHYAIPSERFEPTYKRIKTQRFGHLAGGVDREGKDFMTVYYGAQKIHGTQLASATIVAADRPRDAE